MAVQAAATAEKPWLTGTVTILFSDIEGFTDYTGRAGDAAAYQLLQDHNAIIREELQRYGGIEVKTLGDGFMAVFSSARAAVLCAVQIQKRLTEYAQRYPETPLRVRIGLHAGEPIAREQDFIGQAVNIAARITACAQGSQIWVSDVVRQLVGHIEGIRFEERGWKDLKGVAERQHLYEVIWEESSSAQPPELSYWLREEEVTIRQRWRGQAQIFIHLKGWRLLWASLRLLFRRRHLAILAPFLTTMIIYFTFSYFAYGPPVLIKEPATPAQEGSQPRIRATVKFEPQFLESVLEILILALISPLIAGITIRMVMNAVERQKLLPVPELRQLILKRYGGLLKASLAYVGLSTLGIIGPPSLAYYLVFQPLGVPNDWRMVLGLLPLGIPGGIAFLRWALYLHATLIEGRGPWESLRWSWHATRGNAGAIAAIAFIPSLVTLLVFSPLYNFITLVVQFTKDQPLPIAVKAAWQSGANFAFHYEPLVMLINPWTWAALTLAYLQLREGMTRWIAQQSRRT
ncbi:MAG: adenylate/guanylate cyclase domain-containing protein [Candidatus Bipolaricaulota bacterium]|nr:adenylate/guanylate cyclase domain-containing protein [Candidatus Bipolaricaulota bacterium]MDW8030576.1 adenylate/guanylate cyclase domain-containing protein [Candidatus Bipolaricaulota bacterium]